MMLNIVVIINVLLIFLIVVSLFINCSNIFIVFFCLLYCDVNLCIWFCIIGFVLFNFFLKVDKCCVVCVVIIVIKIVVFIEFVNWCIVFKKVLLWEVSCFGNVLIVVVIIGIIINVILNEWSI